MENNKINIAELLRNCPHGMELDSPAYNNLYFDNIIDSDSYPIKCYTTYNGMLNTVFLTKYGEIRREKNAKCVIFPKGKTTLEGFVPPRKFKDGDIVYFMCNCGDEYTAIFKKMGNKYLYTYIDFNCGSFTGISESLFEIEYIKEVRLATKEEKRNFFDVIKENGYKWNTDTKTLEKIVEPKFKVGDKITNGNISITIDYMDNECYYDMGRNTVTRLFIKYQDDWKLVPEKFDINTLVPFESRVLVRHNKDHKWCGSFFSHIDKDFHSHCYKFVTTAGKSYPMMIPYEGNEHLIGKDKDCDEFYKNW